MKIGTRPEGVACAFQLFVIKLVSSDPASKEFPHGQGIFPQQCVSVYSAIQIIRPEPLRLISAKVLHHACAHVCFE